MLLVRWLLLVVLSSGLVASCGGSGPDQDANSPPAQKAADPARAHELQGVLDEQRAYYRATGMAAAIVLHGRHFWSGGSGLADRRTKVPVTADTTFPIASITKMFVSGLALKLAQEDRLELDEPLSGALPKWPNADRITLRMLLNHTSGVGGDPRRLERDVDRRPRAVWSPHKALRYSSRPHAVPGDKWEYNNANYLLAGLVIEHVTGRRAAEVLRGAILEPLKLHDVVLQPQESPVGEPAHGYGGPPRVARALRIGGRYAPYSSEASSQWTAGGMVATAPSVARFADALLRGNLLAPNWRRQILQFVPATHDPYEGYGLGVGKVRLGAEEAWGHVGLGPRFMTSVVHLPGEAMTVAVLSSGEVELGSLTELLADAAVD